MSSLAPPLSFAVSQLSAPTAALPAELAQLEAACFADPWGAASLAATLAQPGCTVALLRPLPSPNRTAPLLAYCLSRSCAGELEILQIATKPSAQRQGLGQQLLARVIADAGKSGCTTIFLEVRRSNLAARALYDRAGFVLCGVRRAYYPPPPGAATAAEDALLLRRPLGSPGDHAPG